MNEKKDTFPKKSTVTGFDNKSQAFNPANLSRRDFIVGTTAVAGASMILPSLGFTQTPSKNNDIRVGLIGAGSQGRVLINSVLKIPGVRFVAVADIWGYSQKYASGILKRFEQPVTTYEDYREMLENEELDAVLISTPDWLHAEMTEACLEAGLAVYCEKEMANTIEDAVRMVKAQRKTGKLLQVGHQRRSNPRYKHALRLIEKDGILGQITSINAQWNRPVQQPLGWPEKWSMEKSLLEKYGYESMDQFRNWRWYKKYAGGPIVDLGSHQIEVFNWFLGATPATVMASGGINYYDDNREWFDNVMAIYEYKRPTGNVQAFYQVLNTTSYRGFYEAFMGDEGTLIISEDKSKGFILREARAKKREWEDLSEKVETMGQDAIELKIGETRRQSGEVSPEVLQAEEDMMKPEHQPHLENFFRAMRGEDELNCPVDVAYESAVTVLKVNEAAMSGQKLTFADSDFHVS